CRVPPATLGAIPDRFRPVFGRIVAMARPTARVLAPLEVGAGHSTAGVPQGRHAPSRPRLVDPGLPGNRTPATARGTLRAGRRAERPRPDRMSASAGEADLIRAVLADANVLYSRVLRDYLLYSADQEIIAITWSAAILDEATEHLMLNVTGFDRAAAR